MDLINKIFVCANKSTVIQKLISLLLSNKEIIYYYYTDEYPFMIITNGWMKSHGRISLNKINDTELLYFCYIYDVKFPTCTILDGSKQSIV